MRWCREGRCSGSEGVGSAWDAGGPQHFAGPAVSGFTPHLLAQLHPCPPSIQADAPQNCLLLDLPVTSSTEDALLCWKHAQSSRTPMPLCTYLPQTFFTSCSLSGGGGTCLLSPHFSTSQAPLSPPEHLSVLHQESLNSSRKALEVHLPPAVSRCAWCRPRKEALCLRADRRSGCILIQGPNTAEFAPAT